METVYDVRRRPIAKIDEQSCYIYLRQCDGKIVAKFDKCANKTYDTNGRLVGNGNVLQRMIPVG